MNDPNSKSEWHREAIGGMWDELGKHQFDYLIKQGLQKEHYFLDIGCGSLRGGVHFIKYLETGHYFGIDINNELLEAGKKIEIPSYNLENKNPKLFQTENFEIESFQQKFDYVLAQSVFTHLPINNIIRCMMNVEKVLSKDGKFYATFMENPKGKFNLEPIQRTGGYSYFDKDPYHYDFKTFEWICEGIGLKVDYLGKWNSPKGPHGRVLLFTKRS